MAEIEAKPVAAEAEPPHSIASASVDDKGRLKLPSEFQEYLEAIGATKVFITTTDLRMARIYPIEVWKVNEKLFLNAGPSAAAATRLAFISKAYGGDSDVDKSGRVLLPAKLREELKLEKQPVWVYVYKGHIRVLDKAAYDEQMAASKAHLASDAESLDQLGFL
jgi:MraZ protein